MKYILIFTFSSLLMLKISTQSNEDLVAKSQENSLSITFPEKGSLYNEDIKITFQKLEQQLNWKIIYVLVLKNVSGGEIFKGASFDAFPVLSRLEIKNSRINYFPESTFEGLFSIFWLELIDIKLKSLSANLFKSTSKLETIRLSINELEDLPAGVFSNLPEVTEIRLDSNKLKTLPNGIFHRSLKKLTHLFLMDNLIRRLEENVFMTEQLMILNLSLNAVSHVEKNTFKELSNLKEIIMTKTFTDKIQSLPKDIFPNSSKLETIKMNQNHFESLEVGIFHNLSGLGELDLSFNKLTNLSDKILENNIHLRLLYLSNNKLSHLGK